MSLLALLLSQSSQLGVRAAVYDKEAAQAHALACGGVEAAVAEIAYPRSPDEKDAPAWAWKPGQRRDTVTFERGKADLEIVAETGKVDLNFAGREQLSRLFVARDLDPQAASDLASAVVDRRSPAGPDSEASDEYYRARPESDRPRHAPFVFVEEALRVRGMTREIYYGTVEVTREGKIRKKYGVGQDLTVRSGSPAININYASAQALESVPGMDAATAHALVAERARAPFSSVAEVGQRLPIMLPDESLPFLETGEAKFYTIISVGQVTGSPVRRAVQAVIQVVPQGTVRHRMVGWSDDYPND